MVRGRWSDLLLLRNRIQLVDVVDLHVVVPPVGSRENHEDFPAGSSADFSGPSTVVEEFHIHQSRLDIQRTNGELYSFPINDLLLRNVQRGRAISYAVDMQNAMPVGHILARVTGNLIMNTDISHTTTDFKSLFLKPLAPFFKRGRAGAEVPVAFTGISGNYKVSQNIFDKQ